MNIVVVKQDQNSEYFYLIASGQIEVYNQNNNNNNNSNSYSTSNLLLTHSSSTQSFYSPINSREMNYQSMMMSNYKYISLLERCQVYINIFLLFYSF